MAFNPLSLLELSEKTILNNFVFDFENLAGILPKSLYNALFQKWLCCTENFDLSDEDNDKIYDILKDTDIFEASGDTKPSFLIRRCVIAFNKEKYDEYPSLPYILDNTFNHIVMDYIIERKIFGGEKNLCDMCFKTTSHYTLPFCGNLWDRDMKYYLNMFDHAEVSGNKVFTKFMKDSFYWCSNCHIVPLFKIVDIDECVMQHHSERYLYRDHPENFFYVSNVRGKYNEDLFKDHGHLFL